MSDPATIALLAIALACAAGANARIARLIAEDEISEPLRAMAVKRFGDRNLLVRWAHCPWCCGFWVAWPLTATAWFPLMGLHNFPVFLLAGWAVAHAAGRLNHDHGWRGR